MSMTRQEQLDAVVRNYGEWPGDSFMDCYNVDAGNVHFSGSNREMCATDTPYFTRAEVEARKAELQNKPSWDDAPDWADWLAQDGHSGEWFWYKVEPRIEEDEYFVTSFNHVWTSTGEVVGDWRETLERRPSQPDHAIRNGEDIDQPTPEEEEAFKAMEKKSATNSDLYPQYFKDVSDLREIDVYVVHQLFAVDDPSGAIQHASKKLLLSGVRTGGKGKYKDIKEARDTLNRWLQMNEEK